MSVPARGPEKSCDARAEISAFERPRGGSAARLHWSRTALGSAAGRAGLALGIVAVLGLSSRAAAQIAFIQVNAATPQSSSATVSVPYVLAQSAGNLNVVVGGWNDSVASVSSVTDTRGNVYQLAVGPTVIAGTSSQAIYYAAGIGAAAGGANTVTVQFTTAARYADVLEPRNMRVSTPRARWTARRRPSGPTRRARPEP